MFFIGANKWRNEKNYYWETALSAKLLHEDLFPPNELFRTINDAVNAFHCFLLRIIVPPGAQPCKLVIRSSFTSGKNTKSTEKMSSISEFFRRLTVPRITDQFGCKRCQKKRKDVDYKLFLRVFSKIFCCSWTVGCQKFV